MTGRRGVETDRVLAALQRHVLDAGEQVEERFDRQDSLVAYTKGFRYQASSADWVIAREPWVEDAVRVVADGSAKNFVFTYGLVFDHSGGVLFLNDVATMRELGSRLGDGLDPLGYAELLGELYSGRNIDGPVVLAAAATEFFRAGGLIRDVDGFLADYPFVDASLLSAPAVRRTADEVAVEFCSYHYYLVETTGAVDILKWTVVGGGEREGSWSRRYVAERLERPY
ncbi:MAG: hypothetical protein QOE61_5176 [Micromonosporaceae bacterium]|nr:hypothetical protein [Micromonosporaceae bacterium]